jgi:hypothetical protein
MDEFRRSSPWRSSRFPSGYVSLSVLVLLARSHLCVEEGGDRERQRDREGTDDRCTSGAMITISTPTFWAPPMLSGVSIDLNVQYYHPVMAYGSSFFLISSFLFVSSLLYKGYHYKQVQVEWC